jgi:iron-sulfur cluster repair protein YtfE (RIC family)
VRPLALVPEDTVAAAALRSPHALLVLQRFGIDACCGGHLTLVQAAASAGVPVETVLGALESGGAMPTT